MGHFFGGERSLDHYVNEINRYPLLSRSQESALATDYQTANDEKAARKLIVSNLRFVVKTAHEYRGYGLKLLDLVQEGNMGLMVAVQKFDPGKGYRLVSYAVWWIRAYIQSFIMRAWSLVKVGTTQAQRKLFFRLRSEREKADKLAPPGERAAVADIAEKLAVSEGDVRDMEVRLGDRDFSLDAKVAEHGRSAHLDLLASGADDQEETFAQHQRLAQLRQTVTDSMKVFNEKEKYVVENRLLCDNPPTLQEIGATLRISRERVRQIEGNIIRKMRIAMDEQGKSQAA